MARWHPKHCRVEGCTAPADEISARGYCLLHGMARENANQQHLKEANGYFYDHWVRRSWMEYRNRLRTVEQTKG